LDIDYDQIHGLSMGEREVLKLVRPSSVGMARRTEGVTPAGALRLLKHAKRAGSLVSSVSRDPPVASEELLQTERAGAEGGIGAV